MENSNNKFIVLEGIFDGDAQSIYREMEGIMRAVHSKEANNKTSEWLLSFGEISITGKDFTPKGTISGVVANRFLSMDYDFSDQKKIKWKTQDKAGDIYIEGRWILDNMPGRKVKITYELELVSFPFLLRKLLKISNKRYIPLIMKRLSSAAIVHENHEITITNGASAVA